jgi:hypothetical protein
LRKSFFFQFSVLDYSKGSSMQTALLSLFILSFAPSAFAFKQFTVKETLEDGNVKVRVIAEDETLHAQQNRISQQVIYEKIFLPNQVPATFPIPDHFEKNLKFPHAAKPLWIAKKNSWSAADETAYSEWFAQQTVDFDTDTGLVADCADMGLLFRWVYARNNLLPVANTLDGSGKIFGQFSSSAEWDALPTDPDWKKDERFKAALRYLFDNTYTWSIVGDIYPTQMNPSYVRPGSMFMIIRSHGGHTQTIHEVDSQKGITTFWGNEPAAEKIDQSGIIIEFQNKEKFGRWRTPALTTTSTGTVWELTASNKMPGFSMEQYQQGFLNPEEMIDWDDARLGIHETDDDRLAVLLNGFVEGIEERLMITAQSEAFCFLVKCAADSDDYSNYSSFARDSRLKSEQVDMAKLIQKLGPADAGVLQLNAELSKYGLLIQGTTLTYTDLVQDPTRLAAFVSDPHATFAARWGLNLTNPDPTIQFYALAEDLIFFLGARSGMVDEGYLRCEHGCDPKSPSIKVVNTGRLDGGIRAVFTEVMDASQASGVDAAALPAVRAFYAKAYLHGFDANSSDPKTYDDVIWVDGAAERMKIWSPRPQDDLNKRWGFPENSEIESGRF